MSKKYYWIIDGKYYEVSKETYQKFKREYDHAKMLEEYEKEVVVLSLDAVTSGEHSLSEVIPDTKTNVEADVIHKILIEKMLSAREELPSGDKLLLELLSVFDDKDSCCAFSVFECGIGIQFDHFGPLLNLLLNIL